MAVVLYRVDDRLIHGQVVIGWGQPLGVGCIVLVDDQVAGSSWEQELYRMGAPSGVELQFASVTDAIRRLPEWDASGTRVIVLTGQLEAMSALHEAVPSLVRRINIGGIHHRPGRTERLPYLYLTDAELLALRALAATGAEVAAQDLPTTLPVPVGSLR